MSSVLLASCGARQANDGDDIADGMPEWSPCAMKDEVQTCAELCATQGMQCVANGCPAEPEFCDPEPCDMATQVLALDAEAVCADPSSGAFVATTCEAPIDWLFSNTVRCCCAE
ncbi:hypothetical protein [Enhygromyxa salina]|uniref:hypothetical protein n=1 Tax=Enhygromyxa salina TaxID=215803 RepID=UPI0015E5A32A|nr:hypothetical protein [Enhygromyxa salina]